MDTSYGTLEIADMNDETVKSVADLERLCFTPPWSLDSLRAELANPLAVFRTASVNGTIVGYVGMHHVIDEGYVTNVAVNPGYRRCGVACTLMDSLIGYGRENGLHMITLEVRESNMAARELYKNLCFKDVGRRKNFYSSPAEDAVLMTLELDYSNSRK